MSNKKETAVSWLIGQMPIIDNPYLAKIFNDALEMGKQQIIEAYWDGGQDIPLTENRCEQYYNETFKK